ncbi:MAG: head-tail adaptor protein [Bacteroidales bacterium]|nr:head-tail adaptor protein [Bacteroidales bacterium]
MEVAHFNRYVYLKTPVTTVTSSGAAKKVFSVLQTLWMGREYAGGGEERIVNNRQVVPKQFRYHCHKECLIDETMRLEDDGKDYDILSVTDYDAMFFEIVVEEVLQ